MSSLPGLEIQPKDHSNPLVSEINQEDAISSDQWSDTALPRIVFASEDSIDISVNIPEFPSSLSGITAKKAAEVTSENNAEPIFETAWDCDELLTRCLNQAHKEGLTTEPMVEQYKRSFEAWWKYLGVFAEKTSNLDRRLRKKPGIHDMVVRLLLILKDSLAQLIKVSDGIIGSADALESFSTSKYILESIEETLEDLSRVAIAIRKSAKITETSRARAFTAERPGMNAYEVLCSIALELLYQNSPETLIQQLSESMVNRYARQLFRAPRQNLLDQDLRQPVRSDNLTSLGQNFIRKIDVSLSTSAIQLYSQDEKKSSSTNAPISSVDTLKFQEYRSKQDNLKVHPSGDHRPGTTVILGKIQEPPLPVFGGKQQVQCEWCFRPLGTEIVEDKRWSAKGRDHYRKDLEPYPCIWQNCSKGAPEFSSMREWTAHMLQHHRHWKKHVHSQALWKCSLETMSLDAHPPGDPTNCPTCTSQYPPGPATSEYAFESARYPLESATPQYTHESATYFASAGHFLGHVRTVHKLYTEDWTEEEFSTLMDESMVPQVLASGMCPICYLVPTDLEASGPRSLQNHIVEHLQIVMLLSLRLLRYPQGHPEDEEDGDSVALAEVPSSRVAEELSDQDGETHDPMSPFPSPPQSLRESAIKSEEPAQMKDWNTITGGLLEKKRVDLAKDSDPTLDHIRAVTKERVLGPDFLSIHTADDSDTTLDQIREMINESDIDSLSAGHRSDVSCPSLSPFSSPPFLPQATNDLQGEGIDAWENLTSRIMNDRKFTLGTEFDPVLAHIKVASERPPLQGLGFPFIRNRHFVGRQSELADLTLRFEDGELKGTSIVGLGGIGKTECAKELAFIIANKHPDCSVFWLSAVETVIRQEPGGHLTGALKIPGYHQDNVRPAETLSQSYLDGTHSGQWLLIIDGLESLALWESLRLPKVRQGQVIFTTRNKDLAAELSGSMIEIRGLSDSDSIQLLLNATDRRDEPGYVEAMQEICARLDGLPIAIVEAVAYMKSTQCTIDRYLSLLKELQDEDGVFELFDDSLATLWLSAFESISSDNYASAVLASLSCFLPHKIPIELLPEYYVRKSSKAASNPVLLERALRLLSTYSLVEWHNEEVVLEMPQLVSAALRKWIQSLGRWDDVLTDVVRLVEEKVSACDDADLTTRGLLVPHVTNVVKFLEPNHLKSIKLRMSQIALLDWIGSTENALGNYEAGQRVYRRLLDRKTIVLGRNSLETLTTLYDLGLTLLKLNRYDEAQAMFEETWVRRQDMLGSEHPDTLSCASQLGSLRLEAGNYGEALELFNRAYQARKNVLGQDHPDTLSSAHDLGKTLRLMKRYADATEMLQIAYRGRLEKFGIVNPSTLQSAVELADVDAVQGRRRHAIKLLQQVLETRIGLDGFEHPDTLDTASKLASMLISDGKYAEAERLCRRVHEVNEKTLGACDVATLDALFLIGLACDHQRKYKEAITLWRQLLGKTEDVFGATHVRTMVATEELARVLADQGDFKEAEILQRKLVFGREQELGEMHPYTLRSLYNLAILVHRMQDFTRAIDLYEIVVHKFVKAYGAADHHTTDCTDNYERALQHEWPPKIPSPYRV